MIHVPVFISDIFHDKAKTCEYGAIHTTEIIETAFEKAREILTSESSPIGLMASPEGYPHVWARDSVITSPGAAFLPEHSNCLRLSLETLGGQQSELGAIPNNVSVATGRLDHTNVDGLR
ncbi:MAG: hypothetical protein HZB51_25165 [Chloroflexi bacterium]|nr:hypothetical protein [Chloroflexota bacterium]